MDEVMEILASRIVRAAQMAAEMHLELENAENPGQQQLTVDGVDYAGEFRDEPLLPATIARTGRSSHNLGDGQDWVERIRGGGVE